jgi:hypothetical protein
MRNHLKLDQLLNETDREEFLKLARHPGTTAASAHQWLMDKGIVIGRNAVYAFIRRERAPGQREKSRNFFLKIDKVLLPKHRSAYERLARAPKTTLEDLQQFFKDRGYENVGITAVRTHRNRLRERLREVRKAAHFARDLAQVVVEFGPEVFRGGAVAGVDQEIMQRVLELREMQQITPDEFGQWGKSLRGFAELREQLIPSPPQQEGDSSRQKPRSLDGVGLSNAVRRIFGVPLPGEPAPRLPAPPPLPGPSSVDSSTEHTEATEHTENKREDE